MKMIKMALLGGAALAVSAVAAQADDLTSMKAQIEALNARVAAMEAAPSVPAGYSLMTLSEGPAQLDPFGNAKEDASYLPTAHRISILPTADAPAAASIDWSGFVRTMITYHDDGVKGDPIDTNVGGRAELKIVAKNDTAVGQVGVDVRLRVNTGGNFLDTQDTWKSPKWWGWWAMTPELTLGGGFAGSQGSTGYGVDGACTCISTDNTDLYFNPGDSHQVALMYKSGPIHSAIAIEDVTNLGHQFGGNSNSMGVAANVGFSGDTVNGAINAAWHDGGRADDSYIASLGLGFNLGMATVSAVGSVGQISNGQSFWGTSAIASFAMTDAIHAELGAGYKNYGTKKNPNLFGAPMQDDEMGILAGFYYSPVSQLTLGLEGEYRNHLSSNVKLVKDAKDEVYAGFVTVWSF